MSYKVYYSINAEDDLDDFDCSVRNAIVKAINKVAVNPLPKNEGGYGEPLGHKHGRNLTGLLKIKLLKPGVRVIYRLVRDGDIMRIIVVAARADDEVYRMASERQNEEK